MTLLLSKTSFNFHKSKFQLSPARFSGNTAASDNAASSTLPDFSVSLRYPAAILPVSRFPRSSSVQLSDGLDKCTACVKFWFAVSSYAKEESMLIFSTYIPETVIITATMRLISFSLNLLSSLYSPCLLCNCENTLYRKAISCKKNWQE